MISECGSPGSIIAFPGVLWKVGAFFLPFLIARLIVGHESKLIPLVGMFVAVYLVVLDGSRTGAIWIAFCFTLFALVWIFNTRQEYILMAWVGFLIFVFFLAVVWLWSFDTSTLGGGVLAFERLKEGDQVRSQMLLDGMRHAENCLPFGCGFGTSVSITEDGPMVVHNALISTLGDLGVVGFSSLLFLLAFPVFMALKKSQNRQVNFDYYRIAALMGVSGFAFEMLLHPLSTEMSEWGLYLIMVAWLNSVLRYGYMYGNSVQ